MKLSAHPHNPDNAISASIRLCKALEVNITESSLKSNLVNHIDFPSIIAISDSLSSFRVDNMIAKVPFEELASLEPPFIARLNLDGGSFFVITNITEQKATYASSDRQADEKDVTLNELNNIWTELVLIAEKNAYSGELDYSKKLQQDRQQKIKTPALLLVSAVIIVYYLALPALSGTDTGIIALLFTVTKILGTLISALLLTNEIEKDNPLLKFVCKPGKKVNCSAILNSKGSKVFSWLSWSEIGFFYFSGSLLLLLMLPAQAVAVKIIECFSLFAFPYTVYSVFYQWRIAKQWCMLCLLIQILLAAELIITLSDTSFTANSLLNLVRAPARPGYFMLLAFGIPILLWISIKSHLIRSRSSEPYKRNFLQIKRDPKVFATLLTTSPRIFPEELTTSVIWGDTGGENTITMVCSPYCKPCAMTSPVVTQLSNSIDNLKIQLVFIQPDPNNDRNISAINHLLACINRYDDMAVEQIISDWWHHSQREGLPAFIKQYPRCQNPGNAKEQIEEMYRWSKRMNISFTPTFYLNGFELPSLYNIEDLRHILTSYSWSWDLINATAEVS